MDTRVEKDVTPVMSFNAPSIRLNPHQSHNNTYWIVFLLSLNEERLYSPSPPALEVRGSLGSLVKAQQDRRARAERERARMEECNRRREGEGENEQASVSDTRSAIVVGGIE